MTDSSCSPSDTDSLMVVLGRSDLQSCMRKEKQLEYATVIRPRVFSDDTSLACPAGKLKLECRFDWGYFPFPKFYCIHRVEEEERLPLVKRIKGVKRSQQNAVPPEFFLLDRETVAKPSPLFYSVRLSSNKAFQMTMLGSSRRINKGVNTKAWLEEV